MSSSRRSGRRAKAVQKQRKTVMNKAKAGELDGARGTADNQKSTEPKGGTKGAALQFVDAPPAKIPFTPNAERVAALSRHARDLNSTLPKRERAISFGGIQSTGAGMRARP